MSRIVLIWEDAGTAIAQADIYEVSDNDESRFLKRYAGSRAHKKASVRHTGIYPDGGGFVLSFFEVEAGDRTFRAITRPIRSYSCRV